MAVRSYYLPFFWFNFCFNLTIKLLSTSNMDIGQTKLTKDSTNITCIIYGPNENINKKN